MSPCCGQGLGIRQNVCAIMDASGMGAGGSEQQELAPKLAKMQQGLDPNSIPALGEITQILSRNARASESQAPLPPAAKSKSLDFGDPESLCAVPRGNATFRLLPRCSPTDLPGQFQLRCETRKLGVDLPPGGRESGGPGVGKFGPAGRHCVGIWSGAPACCKVPSTALRPPLHHV